MEASRITGFAMDIADRRIATVHFTLQDEQGRAITSTHGHAPLVYMHGTGSIMPGLEQALAGKAPGDTFRVTIAPEAGFGPRHGAIEGGACAGQGRRAAHDPLALRLCGPARAAGGCSS